MNKNLETRVSIIEGKLRKNGVGGVEILDIGNSAVDTTKRNTIQHNTADDIYFIDKNGVSILMNSAINQGINPVTILNKTADHTLVDTEIDGNTLIEMEVAVANTVSIDISVLSAIDEGKAVMIIQKGVGQTSVVGTGGVTILSANGSNELTFRYSVALLIKCSPTEAYLWGDIGEEFGVGGGITEYQLSSTAPTNTQNKWVDTGNGYLECYPIRVYVDGAWTSVDAAGDWYDSIGKVISRGKPYVIVASGQSNLGGPYINEIPDPNDPPYLGYYGDIVPSAFVSGWDNTLEVWVVGQIGVEPFQYSSGANYMLLLGKKIALETGRSIRIVTYPQGGTGLECWAGEIGQPIGGACYDTFADRMSNSGMQNPDLFVWAQSEAGISGSGGPITPTTYYDKFIGFTDRLKTEGFISDSTITLCMASGDIIQSQALTSGNGNGGGDGALRALAASNDRYITYIDGVGVETDGIHITPKGHEECARRMFAKLKQMPKDPSKDIMGYGALAPWKLSSNKQEIVGTGLAITNSAGGYYIDLETSSAVTKFKGPTANAALQNAAALTFEPITFNIVKLQHYNGTTKVQLEDTRVLVQTDLHTPAITILNGANATLKLLDNGTTGLAWAISNIAASNFLTFKYDNVTKLQLKPALAQLYLGTTIPGAISNAVLFGMDSTVAGFLTPRMTTAQKNAISNLVEGLELFDTDLQKKCVYTATGWQTITSA